jgi:hypothetical protein
MDTIISARKGYLPPPEEIAQMPLLCQCVYAAIRSHSLTIEDLKGEFCFNKTYGNPGLRQLAVAIKYLLTYNYARSKVSNASRKLIPAIDAPAIGTTAVIGSTSTTTTTTKTTKTTNTTTTYTT